MQVLSGCGHLVQEDVPEKVYSAALFLSTAGNYLTIDIELHCTCVQYVCMSSVYIIFYDLLFILGG